MNERSGSNAVIIGCGDHGVVALRILQASGTTVSGFLDDDPSTWGTNVVDLPVLGDATWLRSKGGHTAVFVAIGANTARSRVAAGLRAQGVRVISAIHPSAVLMNGVRRGLGAFVGAGAVVVSGSVIGDDVIVNTGATIDHDSVVEDGAHIAPGVHTGGRVRIGEGSLVGIGASLGAGVIIGPGSVVGAGSVVLQDVPAGVVVAGVPARVIRELDGEIDWGHVLRPRARSESTER